MPVDIAKAYFELQHLRKQVRKAERELIASLVLRPECSLPISNANVHVSQPADQPMPLLKRAIN